jgi:general secretion pathway protein K
MTNDKDDMCSNQRVNANTEQGFVIVAVLWVLAALATLASVYSIYVSNTAAASHVSEDRIRASALAIAGVELTAYRLESKPAAERPSSDAFAFRVGRSTVAVRLVSEGARIDLNAAPKDLLIGLFEKIGGDSEMAPYYADRVIGWRQKGDVAGQNDEAARYRAAGLEYSPRQAPFPSVLELSLVLGVPEKTVRRVLPFVTVFSGRSEIDAINAAPEVIEALPGITPDSATDFLDQRAADPDGGTALLDRLGSARSRVTSEKSKAVRIFVQADLGDGRVFATETVILLTENGDEPYRTLYWNDQLDAPS